MKRLAAKIGDFEMDQVILDIGSKVNVIPKQTWQQMGELKLQWTTTQLRMDNQQMITPLGKLPQVIVNIARVKVRANFEVIHTVGDTDPYPALLGLDWAMAVGGIINLKDCSMTFEKN